MSWLELRAWAGRSIRFLRFLVASRSSTVTMVDVQAKGGCGDTLEQQAELSKAESSDASVDSQQALSPTSLKRHLRKAYGRRPMELVSRYFRAIFDLAAFANKAAFLARCRATRVVPPDYRVECREIKNTRHIVRILDKCSYKLMLADLEYNRMRKVQVSRLLELLHQKLEKVLTAEDLENVLSLSKAKYENIFEATRNRQRTLFTELLKEYEISGKEEEDSED
ncbi:hypothetical protein HPB49_001095 [Dermacentor silvarum]|uniref:Uncharacterized protein n=1 Tax=Dermacentor silvarum TaxID=543639 RepID=A0ACB8DTB8_DERSI|nr:uncharacterized protein LOC119437008 [Dermacentor silvarum]KAH7977369.1 hypothetical protein HPB49_001095 [Dermacentor silvarum]